MGEHLVLMVLKEDGTLADVYSFPSKEAAEQWVKEGGGGSEYEYQIEIAPQDDGTGTYS